MNHTPTEGTTQHEGPEGQGFANTPAKENRQKGIRAAPKDNPREEKSRPTWRVGP